MTDDGTKGGPGWFVLVYKPGGTGAVHPQSGVAALPDDPAGERKMRGVVREIPGRCRDLHAELDEERGASNLTFAELAKFAASVYEAADHGSADSS